MYRLIAILLLWPMLAFGQITSGPQLITNGSGIGSLTVQGATGPYVSLPTGNPNAVGWGAIGGLQFDPANKDTLITLSNGNLTAATTSATWSSAISTGSGKTTGKWYYRLKSSSSSTDDVGAAFCLNTEPTNNLLGNDANGWLGFLLPNGSTGGVWHGAANIGATPGMLAGDYLVAAYDATNAKVYFTKMTAAGVLSTNWDNVNDNPSTNTGGFAVTLGMSLQPGASILTSAGGSVTLDTTTTISDSTLSGFSPYGPH